MQDKNYSKVKNMLLALAKELNVNKIKGLAEFLNIPASNLDNLIT